MKPRMINYPLYHNPVSIPHALSGVASQENCDGPEYDLMMQAAEYIRVLESAVGLQEIHSDSLECISSGPTRSALTKKWLSQQDDPGIAQQAIELLGLN